MKADKFNRSRFSRWINSGAGRVFRLLAGTAFLVTGIIFHESPLGIAAIVWSFFPLSAGLLDLCYISGALGGPLLGSKIRFLQSKSKES